MPENTKKNSDVELMRAYCEGEAWAFEEIYDSYAPLLQKYFLKRIGHLGHDLCDDLLQNTFIVFHRRREAFNPKYPILQHLYVMARSQLMDHYRKEGRNKRLKESLSKESLAELSQSGADVALIKQEMSELLQNLEPRQRELIVGRLIFEKSFEELAEEMNSSSAALRQFFGRLMKSLRQDEGPYKKENEE